MLVTDTIKQAVKSEMTCVNRETGAMVRLAPKEEIFAWFEMVTLYPKKELNRQVMANNA